MISVQTLIVILIVAASAAYVGSTVWKQIRPRRGKKEGCGDDCGCGK